jgi:hypothetical protein
MVRAGVDVVRLNFSHSTHERSSRSSEDPQGEPRGERKPLCILGDLQGPKIRTALLKDHQPVLLKAGHRLTITPRDVPGTAALVGTTFKTLAENVEQGSRILLSDGLIELRVHEMAGDDVVCDIINGGMLGESKGINLPGVLVRTFPRSPKRTPRTSSSRSRTACDAIAVSFVRTAEDVRLVRNRVAAHGAQTWIIAKLEKPQAVEHLDAILQVADGIMVARGDLGVEVPPEKVPAIQKHIIRRAAEYPQAGDHRHADAGIDDREPAAHARRGLRRGQRHLRRHRRRHALRRIGRGQVSGRGGGHDGAHRHRAERHIKENLERAPRERRAAATSRSPKPSAKPRPTPPTTSTCAALRSSPSRAHGAPALQVPPHRAHLRAQPA